MAVWGRYSLGDGAGNHGIFGGNAVKTTIVTGANGFVGSAVVRELLLNGYQTYAIVKNGHCDNLPKDKNLTVVSCDLSELESLPKRIDKCGNFDIFYHFAWPGKGKYRIAATKCPMDGECDEDCQSIGLQKIPVRWKHHGA